MAYFKDLRTLIDQLEANDLLYSINKECDLKTEVMPLVRWQFRGLLEHQRKAFLFNNVKDNEWYFNGKILVGCYASSKKVYAFGMQCSEEEIHNKWVEAQLKPIPPTIVAKGICQEEVHEGDNLLEHGGLKEFPIPISTPGFDNAPYLTAPHYVTRDPETGIYNVGVYRAMVKSATRLGANGIENQHIFIHRRKWREAGYKTMPAAIALGVLPNLAYAAVSSIPYGISEYDIAGAIAGEPLELVKCITSELLVPANAEIIIEGEIDTELLERDGPFGEYTGYMGREKMTPFFNVKCITHRYDPIYSCFISQFPPSESSKLRQIGNEGVYLKYLRYDSNLPAVLNVAFHESGGSWQYCVIRMKKSHDYEPWQALHAAISLAPMLPKIVIAVDEDIDPWDADSVNWALSFRVQPDRDIEVLKGRITGLDPSGAPPTDKNIRYPNPPIGGNALLINATRKFPYYPVSLPKKEFMERALKIWEDEGLPPLTPKAPWFGYDLGHWTEEEIEEAELALRGEHFITGNKVEKFRKKG